MTTNIYTLTDPITNEIRYVGKANNVSKRYYKHCRLTVKNTHKNNWINKLLKKKLKPIVEIIDVVPIDEWVFWETYWISQIRSWGFKLVNSTDGGDGCTFDNRTSFKKGRKAWNEGVAPSEKTKEKIREANLGKKQSDETKAKRSETLKLNRFDNTKELIKGGEKTRFKKGVSSWNKGNKTSNKKSKPVEQLTLDGVFICEHISYNEASKAVNGNAEAIRKCCIGKSKKSAGFKWRYKN